MPGASYGIPGGSLAEDTDTSWAANSAAADAGRRGEQIVGGMLDDLVAVSDGGVVLHDLDIPLSGLQANIDHIVVAGRTVLIVDAKLWAPGIYFTLRGRSYRAPIKRVSYVEKKSQVLATNALRTHLSSTSADLTRPIVAAAASQRGLLSTRFLTMPGARVLSVPAAKRHIRTMLKREGPADPVIVTQLTKLLRGDNAYRVSDPFTRAPDESSEQGASTYALIDPSRTRIPDGGNDEEDFDG